MKEKIKNIITQIPGWYTNRKIVVIQSDDWGTVRMPSLEVYEKLKKDGFIFNDNYNKYDSIEQDEDLEKLFEVLLSIKDFKGNHPIITANCLMANPNFENIKLNGFTNYEYESVEETFKQYNNSNTLKKYWIEGNNKKIFSMQFHGREHLNTALWLQALRQGKKETMAAFEAQYWGMITDTMSAKRNHFLAAFDFDDEAELASHKIILKEGLQMFEKAFGYKSQSFIAPNYVLNNKLNDTLKNNGVNYIQTQRFQIEPTSNGYKNIFRYTGQQTKNGLTYIVRNSHFEPSENTNINWVQNCINEIQTSFILSKPAVISTHRVNFMSRINKDNRDNSLNDFKKLLQEIIKKWPKVEFMSTTELGNLITKEK